MTKMPDDTLVVVADGAGARFFRSAGSADDLSLRKERDLTPRDLANEGPSGSRPEDQTPRQTDEATFAKQLAQSLNKMEQENKFSKLVLIADPKSLGEIRAVISKSVSDSIVLSLNKDLTNHSIADITKAIQA